MAKAYSYLRFSSAAQAEGDSLRRQLKAAMEWSAANPEVELDTSLRDLGVSAFRGEHRVRGALSAFLTRIEKGEIERGSYFLIESFDRLSRENETVAINLLTSITLKGIKVVTLIDGATYDEKSDAMDLMRAIIVMSRAHEENKARGAKLAAAWADKKHRARETGEILSRRGPAWTRFNDATGRFDLIPERAIVIRRIFKEAADGLGGSAIASRLNADGIEPFVETSDGWHPGYVLTILKSRSTVGWYQPTNWSKAAGERAVRSPDGEAIPGYYPAVIDEALFNRVQSVIAQRNKRGGGRGRRGKTFPNILLGLGRCEDCSGTLILGSRHNSTVVRHFRCYQASRKHRCDNRRKYLCQTVEDDLAIFLTRARVEASEVTRDETDLRVRIDALADLNVRIAQLVDQAERGVPFIEDRLRQRQIELVALEREIAELRKSVAAGATRSRASAFSEAVEWVMTLDDATGDDLYRKRAKANALLNDALDWVMPIEGGLYAGAGTQAWFLQGDVVGKFEIDASLEITRENLEAERGPLPEGWEIGEPIPAVIVAHLEPTIEGSWMKMRGA